MVLGHPADGAGTIGIASRHDYSKREHCAVMAAVTEEWKRMRAVFTLCWPAVERVANALMDHRVLEGEAEIQTLVGPLPPEAISMMNEAPLWVRRARRYWKVPVRTPRARPSWRDYIPP